MALRLRALAACLAAVGIAVVIVMVGALFPAVGGSIGKLSLPQGVANLLGGADYGAIAGWMRSEIGAVYGPLVIAAIAITSAVGSTAGDEEDGVLGLVLAHPVERHRLVLAKAAAVAVGVSILALGTWLGLLAGVAIGGGGIAVSDLGAVALHLAFFGYTIGALALALGTTTGRKTVAAGSAAAVALVGFLINGFVPFVSGIAWLKYVSPFYYYAGNDPITNGVDVVDLLVLALVTVALTAVAVAGFARRDLRN
jgi:ABC-2 type transport system permease protein